MQKASRHIRAVSGRIILIGLSLQIILGILWMCCNFGRFQDFGESRFFIEVSKSFLLDEYTGALYPVLLMLVRGMEEMLHIPYIYMMQTVQLMAAFVSSSFFLKASGIKPFPYRVFGSLAMLTVPAAMQCHLALLPNSLNLSVFLLEMAFVVEAVRGTDALIGKQLLKVNLCWLVSALLLPDYLYLGGVPVLLLWIYDVWKYRLTGQQQISSGSLQHKIRGRSCGDALRHLLLILFFAGIITAAGSLIQEPGSYGRPAKTMDAALFRRLNWGSLEQGWDEWPQDMQESCPYDFTLEMTLYPENMEELLQPRLEEAVGVKRAREIYRELNVWALRNRFGVIVRQVVWDAAGYTAPSAILPMFLAGRGYDSKAGQNYEVMKMKTPALTKYYVNYSGWWMAAGILLVALQKIISLVVSVKQRTREKAAPTVICVFTAIGMIGWYTMQGAGVWDYKNALFTGVLWTAWMVSAYAAGKGGGLHGKADS